MIYTQNAPHRVCRKMKTWKKYNINIQKKCVLFETIELCHLKGTHKLHNECQSHSMDLRERSSGHIFERHEQKKNHRSDGRCRHTLRTYRHVAILSTWLNTILACIWNMKSSTPFDELRTSSLMMSDGRRPLPSSGGISEPRRLGGPLPGASDPLRSGSRMTSMVGASMVGALISGTFGPSWSGTSGNEINELGHFGERL